MFIGWATVRSVRLPYVPPELHPSPTSYVSSRWAEFLPRLRHGSSCVPPSLFPGTPIVHGRPIAVAQQVTGAGRCSLSLRAPTGAPAPARPGPALLLAAPEPGGRQGTRALGLTASHAQTGPGRGGGAGSCLKPCCPSTVSSTGLGCPGAPRSPSAGSPLLSLSLTVTMWKLTADSPSPRKRVAEAAHGALTLPGAGGGFRTEPEALGAGASHRKHTRRACGPVSRWPPPPAPPAP